MPDHPVAVVAAYTPAPDHFVREGLLGWASIEVAGLVRLEGVAVRRTRRGLLRLAFPRRRDRRGVEHEVARPLHDGARRQIEAAVLPQLPLPAEGRR